MSDSADPFDSMFGSDSEESQESPLKKRRRRRREHIPEPVVSLKAAASGRALEDVGGVQALRRPVTSNLLAIVFGMDIQTINRRLIDCPHVMQSNRRLYEFKTACSYIIKPVMTPEQFIRTMNASHLPPEINKAFWDGQRSRVKYKIEAQEAWETEDVLAVFGDVFMTIKDVLTTIGEDLRERAKLNDEQSKLLEEGIDELRDTLRNKLVEMPEKKRTGSIFEKPLFGVGGQAPADLPQAQFEDDESWDDE